LHINPDAPLSYTTKSLRKIQSYLKDKGYSIGYDVVGDILKELGYSLQLNQKMLQVGNEHQDRNKQFEYICTLTVMGAEATEHG